MRRSWSHFFLILLCVAGEGADISKPGCPSKCGDLAVPYPFGIGINSSCSVSPFFAIDCDASFHPPKAFLTIDNLEVVGISEGKMSVKNRVALECYDVDENPTQSIQFLMNLSGSPFSFSNDNKLTVVGCDDVAFLSRDDDDWTDLISSCVAICSKPGELSNGFCSGIGCCQSSIPEDLQSIYVYMDTIKWHSKVHNFSSCGYSFLADTNSYSFNVSDISDSSIVTTITQTVPLLIDWAIGNKTCNQIGKSICQPNSVCVDSGSTLGGYRCNCSNGYHGNPYLSPGCQG